MKRQPINNVIHTQFGPWVETVSGRRIDLLRPAPRDIVIEDIAWALSRLNRFCGHTTQRAPYSVAAHSLWVADYLEQTTGDRQLALAGLLHDAHEAYMGDIAQPVKSVSPVLAQELHALSIRTSGCDPPAADMSADAGAAAGTAETRADIDPRDAIAVVRITDKGDDAIRDLNQCIDTYNAVRALINQGLPAVPKGS